MCVCVCGGGGGGGKQAHTFIFLFFSFLLLTPLSRYMLSYLAHFHAYTSYERTHTHTRMCSLSGSHTHTLSLLSHTCHTILLWSQHTHFSIKDALFIGRRMHTLARASTPVHTLTSPHAYTNYLLLARHTHTLISSLSHTHLR